MEMSGEYRIAATREKVWAALNDPEVLKQAIPGCQELERTADNEFTAKVRAKGWFYWRVKPDAKRPHTHVYAWKLEPPGQPRSGGAPFMPEQQRSFEISGTYTQTKYLNGRFTVIDETNADVTELAMEVA